MKKLIISVFIVVIFWNQNVQANIISSVVKKGVNKITKNFFKKGGKSALKELGEYGGEKTIVKILVAAEKEGGEKLVKKITIYTKKYGLTVIKALKDSPDLYIKAIDKLPKSLVRRAFWAVERHPKEMKVLVSKYGVEALEVAAKHRGIGADIVSKLGRDGISVAKKVNTHQAIVIARNADDIAKLPISKRKQVLNFILATPGKTIKFIEKHPGVFLTAGGVALFLNMKDDIVGSEEEITLNPDGSKTIRKVGFIERQFKIFYNPISIILVIFAIIIGLWGIIKIWGTFRREKIKVEHEEFLVTQKKKTHLEKRNH